MSRRDKLVLALTVLCGCKASSQAPPSAMPIAGADDSVSKSMTRAADATMSSLLFDSLTVFVGNPYIEVTIGQWQRQRAVKIVVQDPQLARAEDSNRQRMALTVARYARKFVIRDSTIELIVSGVASGGIGGQRAVFLYPFGMRDLASPGTRLRD